ncbi:MAG: hypothetical protein H0X33_12355 [Taibaiella sp.]|nr:hypothetical protein [Taibaiella sp.]
MIGYPKEYVESARGLARDLEKRLHNVFGMTKVRVMVVGLLCETDASHKKMADMICAHMGMEPEAYTLKTRSRRIVELRWIITRLIRQHYPTITLKNLGDMMGGMDHTTMTNNSQRAQDLLDANDKTFCEKYIKAVAAVEQWLNEQYAQS